MQAKCTHREAYRHAIGGGQNLNSTGPVVQSRRISEPEPIKSIFSCDAWRTVGYWV